MYIVMPSFSRDKTRFCWRYEWISSIVVLLSIATFTAVVCIWTLSETRGGGREKEEESERRERERVVLCAYFQDPTLSRLDCVSKSLLNMWLLCLLSDYLKRLLKDCQSL